MVLIFRKIIRNKKGNAAPILTLAFFLFNIFSFMIIQSFADDFFAESVGNSANLESLAAQANESGTSIITTWSDLSFFRRAGFIIFGLPWWFSLLYITFQGLFISVVVLAWVRGL